MEEVPWFEHEKAMLAAVNDHSCQKTVVIYIDDGRRQAQDFEKDHMHSLGWKIEEQGWGKV